jgi:sorbitol-specific phosphotransferase system component IIA
MHTNVFQVAKRKYLLGEIGSKLKRNLRELKQPALRHLGYAASRLYLTEQTQNMSEG